MLLLATALLFALSPAPQTPRDLDRRAAEDLASFCDPRAREALERVALAEASAEGASGLAAVALVMRNRLATHQWGRTVDRVLMAPGQFEPVERHGDWRALPPPSPPQRGAADAVFSLICDGRIPDFTGGALYFQNPAIVRTRALKGEVSPRLVAFGGASPSAIVGRHAFYRSTRLRPRFRNDPSQAPATRRPADAATGGIFFMSKTGLRGSAARHGSPAAAPVDAEEGAP